MVPEAATETIAVRARVREAEQAARGLLARAAHMEKRAGRRQVHLAERTTLHDRAQELRTAADALWREICELSWHLAARSALTTKSEAHVPRPRHTPGGPPVGNAAERRSAEVCGGVDTRFTVFLNVDVMSDF